MATPPWARPARTLALAALALALASGGCGGSDPAVPSRSAWAYVLAPEQVHHGASYAEWSARWWQWFYEGPFTVHPIIEDRTGEYAWQNQVDPVWFLGGVYRDRENPSVGFASRQVTMPSGRALFFPILNWVAFTWSCGPWDPLAPTTLLRQWNHDAVSGLKNLSFELDGTTIFESPDVTGAARFRAISPEFTMVMDFDYCTSQPGRFIPETAVSDGIWMMLAPLPPGEHTLRFSGHAGDGGFDLEVFYHITVLP